MLYRKFVPLGDAVACNWRPVVGYEALYSVSDTGHVRSELRGLMKQSLNKDGYPHVKLTKDGHSRLCVVHRLVLSAFKGPAPDGMLCAHNDNDETNAHLVNLRWDTQKGNLADREKFGTTRRGERNRNAKLTREAVLKIRQTEGRQNEFAAQYGVSVTSIKNVRSGKTWAHLA